MGDINEKPAESQITLLYRGIRDLASSVKNMVTDLEDLGDLTYGSDEYEIRQNLNMVYSYLKSALRYVGYARSIKEF